jgi:hypothetical protein
MNGNFSDRGKEICTLRMLSLRLVRNLSCLIFAKVSMRQNKTYILIMLLILVSFTLNSVAEERKILFREEFNSLENWKPLYFPKIQKHTSYTIERHGSEHYLRAESNASASALLHKETFNVYEYPRVKWNWEVSNVYAGADPKTKAGDDYPIRMYIIFAYDTEKSGFFAKLRNSLVKKLYGYNTPHSTLSYVWSSKEDSDAIITSPYTDKAKMIILERGSQKAGAWQDEDIHIVEDYRKAFGESPPPHAGLAIMNDSDNTGESSVSFIRYIEVYR